MNVITTTEQLTEFVEHYKSVDAFAFDIETIGDDRLQPVLNDVCWLSFATDNRVDVIPMGHPNGEFEFHTRPILKAGEEAVRKGKPLTEVHFSKNKARWVPQFSSPPEQLTRGEVFRALLPIFFGPALKIGHNVKFDLKSITKYYRGRFPAKPYFDTMMAMFIINNDNKHKLSLKDSVKRELNIDVEKGVGEDISQHSFEDVAKYAAIDAEVTWKLYKAIAPKLTGSLSRVWKLEMDVLRAVSDMELSGATIDTEALNTLSEEIEKGKLEAEKECFKILGRAFNLNSVPEKQLILFKERGLRFKKNANGTFVNPNVLTDRGKKAALEGQELEPHHFSTAADVLEPFREKDPFVKALLTYMDLNKLMTTYVTPYLGGQVRRTTKGKEKWAVKKSLLIDGKVYAKFNAHGAETGRFSSSEPNLQNIPSSGEYGKLVRNLFVAPPGYKLVVADYSQIEPRVIASLSQDPVMTKNYMTGGDIYTTIGDTMGVDRKAGKVLVLAISYGVGPEKIAQSIGCTVKEAKDLMNNFEKKFKSIATYKAKTVMLAKTKKPVPFVETIFGRRRYIPDLLHTEYKFLARAERQAFNTVIQGSAADIMKLALVRAHSCFVNEPEINLSLTVHDELVTVTPADRAEEVAEYIRKSMEGIKLPQITVPLVADVNIVDKWGEAK